MAMGIKSILGEAFRLPSRSHGLFLLILAVSFVPESLLFVVSYMVETPLNAKIAEKLSIYPLMETLGLEETVLLAVARELKNLAIFTIFSWVFGLTAYVLLCTMVVHWASAACQDEKVAPRDLVAKVGDAWRRTLISNLFRIPIFVAYVLAMVLACGLSTLLVLPAIKSVVLMSSWLLVVLVISLAAFIYLGFVCNLAEVVSVMEDGRYGFGAYDRAMKVMRGRRMQGFRLVLAMSGIEFVLFFLYELTWIKAVAAGQHLFLLRLVNVGMRVLLGIFRMAACTMFYEDSKNSRGEKSALAGLVLHFD